MTTNIPPKIIFTDVDDTLTLHGELPVDTLIALYKLRDANIEVIPVTGACAGWCDQMARLWPVSAVIGENGAFCIERNEAGLRYIETQQESQRRDHHRRLTDIASQVLAMFPKLALAQDNTYRRYDLAIDYNQQRKGSSDAEIQAALDFIHANGFKATASSIHINVWLGQHDKKQGALQWLARHRPQWTEPQIKQHCAYIGDSLNDDAMFGYFTNTAAVANIAPFYDKLHHKPQQIMSLPGGAGFSEWVDGLLR
ncbi:hypothetical protein ST37_00210 [Vibrio sp. qd031]|uniref:HAD-IIB family hydrolase n=1 Tax=Vibrio sp. qd031 TaxID=1603038 RepID=UPI000A101E67|nr:HAD-IIB family hydrolase [Vibrio sp. qd031]ORT52766.1 hypothetical protein ST37_00210 [Vibrio sp. qd031]